MKLTTEKLAEHRRNATDQDADGCWNLQPKDANALVITLLDHIDAMTARIKSAENKVHFHEETVALGNKKLQIETIDRMKLQRKVSELNAIVDRLKIPKNNI